VRRRRIAFLTPFHLREEKIPRNRVREGKVDDLITEQVESWREREIGGSVSMIKEGTRGKKRVPSQLATGDSNLACTRSAYLGKGATEKMDRLSLRAKIQTGKHLTYPIYASSTRQREKRESPSRKERKRKKKKGVLG